MTIITRCTTSSRVAPAVEPVTIAEVKTQARVDYTDHDTEFTDLVTEARQWAEENELGRCLINQTVTEKFRRFEGDLELRWPPVSSVTSVVYVDTNGVSQNLATTYYELGHYLGISYCRLKYGQTWPTTRDQEDAVTITYISGYGASGASVPVAIRNAIKCYAVYRYDGNLDNELLLAARRLLGPYSAKR